MEKKITVKPIPLTKSEIKKYVKFEIDLYAGNPYYVPPLIMDDVNTLLPSVNPAFEFCEAQPFMAYVDDRPVGRITAIINRTVNARTGDNTVRFGFVDFIDDADVVDALFKAVEQWGKERGMDKMVGPMGFTDLDHEGMLISGFEELGTMATIYNYPYYPKHMERMGFGSEAEYVEYRMTVPDAIPEKYRRIAQIVEKRFDLHTLSFTSRKKLKDQYGLAIFILRYYAYVGL